MKGKLLLTAMLASSLVSSSAFATLARQAVMGNQPVWTSNASSNADMTVNTVNGSLWYDDDYNVFYNPSYVMDNKNYVVVQKGFEGGFFSSAFDNFAYGLYFNRGASTFSDSRGYAANMVAPGINQQLAYTGGGSNVAAAQLDTQRPIDLFIAGDTGVKWGLHVAWAYNRTQTVATKQKEGAEVTNRYWHFDLGAQVMGFEPFVGATLFSKYQNDTGATTANQVLDEFNVGVRYKYEGWTPYALFRKYRESGNLPDPTLTRAAANQQSQTRVNVYGGGVGHDTKVADGVHVLKNIGVWWFSVEDDAATSERNEDFYDMVLPIDVALEAEATSWLTLRAGANYHLINQRKYARDNAQPTQSVNDKVASNTGVTSFRIGSTFKFGKLHMDSAFGVGTTAVTGTETLDASNFGFDSQTFALVSASYHW